MIGKILIAIVGFIFGCVSMRFWEAWITRRKLDKCLKEIVARKLRISPKTYLSGKPYCPGGTASYLPTNSSDES